MNETKSVGLKVPSEMQSGILDRFKNRMTLIKNNVKIAASALSLTVKNQAQEAANAPSYRKAFDAMAPLGRKMGKVAGIPAAYFGHIYGHKLLQMDPTNISSYIASIIGGVVMGRWIGESVGTMVSSIKNKEQKDAANSASKLARIKKQIFDAINAYASGDRSPRIIGRLNPLFLQKINNLETKINLQASKVQGAKEGAALGGKVAGAAAMAVYASDGLGAFPNIWGALRGEEVPISPHPHLASIACGYFARQGAELGGNLIGGVIGLLIRMLNQNNTIKNN